MKREGAGDQADFPLLQSAAVQGSPSSYLQSLVAIRHGESPYNSLVEWLCVLLVLCVLSVLCFVACCGWARPENKREKMKGGTLSL